MTRIVLASGSPRRRELLAYADVPFTVAASSIEEVVDPQAAPSEVVVSLALQKAEDVCLSHPDAVVIGADTIVVHGGRMLGKPKDEAEAAQMLRLLSGQAHEVYTGVAIVADGRSLTFYERTEVVFWELAEAEIAAYIATGEPMDKAGSYGIQGKGCVLVKEIRGDYYSVVGLPIARLKRELHHFIE